MPIVNVPQDEVDQARLQKLHRGILPQPLVLSHRKCEAACSLAPETRLSQQTIEGYRAHSPQTYHVFDLLAGVAFCFKIGTSSQQYSSHLQTAPYSRAVERRVSMYCSCIQICTRFHQ